MSDRECEREGCDQPGTVQRLVPVSQVLSVWKYFCLDHNPVSTRGFDKSE